MDKPVWPRIFVSVDSDFFKNGFVAVGFSYFPKVFRIATSNMKMTFGAFTKVILATSGTRMAIDNDYPCNDWKIKLS